MRSFIDHALLIHNSQALPWSSEDIKQMQTAPQPCSSCWEETEYPTCCEEGEDSYLDPTLASCCQKDLREQNRIVQAKKALLSVDRVDKRNRTSRAVIVPLPTAVTEGSGSDFDDAGGNEDGGISLGISAQGHRR